MNPETITCRICDTVYEITESILCSCGERIFLSKELQDKIRELDRTALQARTEATMLQVELWQRERQRNASIIKRDMPAEDFWKNVHGKPGWAGGKKRREKIELLNEIELAEFE